MKQHFCKNKDSEPILVKVYFNCLNLIVLIGTAVLTTPRSASGQCSANIEFEMVSAEKAKCGYSECEPSYPPVVYLKSRTIITESFLGEGTDACFDPPNTFFHSDSKKRFSATGTYNRLTCEEKFEYSGSIHENIWDIDLQSAQHRIETSTITNSSMNAWSGNSGLSIAMEPEYVAETEILARYGLGDYSSESTNICTSTYSGAFWHGEVHSPEGFGCAGPGGSYHDYRSSTVTLLSKPYSDSDLRKDMISLIPAFPNDPSAWTKGGGEAFYHLSPDHKSCRGGKARFRVFICGESTSEKDQNFKIEWTRTTIFDDTNQPPIEVTPTPINFTGSGDSKGRYIDLPPIDVPKVPCTIRVSSTASVTPTSSGGGGNGGGDGGDGGSGDGVGGADDGGGIEGPGHGGPDGPGFHED